MPKGRYPGRGPGVTWCRENGVDVSLYHIWCEMRARCRNPTHWAYKWYGGRGIRVCERWHSFLNFILDMGPRPGKEWSIDRIDNDKDYGPTNCRWATMKTQIRNSSRTKLTVEKVNEIRNRPLTKGAQRRMAVEFGVCESTISMVLRRREWL